MLKTNDFWGGELYDMNHDGILDEQEQIWWEQDDQRDREALTSWLGTVANDNDDDPFGSLF